MPDQCNMNIPPAVQALAKSLSAYYKAKMAFWTEYPPQVLAAIRMITSDHLDAPDYRRTPPAEAIQVATRHIRYYRDVRAFADNVRNYTRRNPTSPLVNFMEALLEGDALDWYANVPSDAVRDAYFFESDGIERWLSDLEHKFRLNPLQASRKLEAIRYGPSEVKAGKTTDSYVTEIHHAMAAVGTATTDEALVHTAWYHLNPTYRRQVGPPAANTTLQEFIEHLDRYKTLWEDELLDDVKTPSAEKEIDRPKPTRFIPRRAMAADSAVVTPESGVDNCTEPSSFMADQSDQTPAMNAIAESLRVLTQGMERLLTRPQGNNNDRRGQPNRPFNRDRRRDDRPRNHGPDFYQERNKELDGQLKPEGGRTANLAEDTTSDNEDDEHESTGFDPTA
ncbi:hypothetical protein AAP_04736 [Ascosphaera apis ARSEF 7405]|uniref:Retrotransposon gag domain-containing protein n=1 Tax=Ascosphaera apis ARSEF 7405 TaxID=392613 RepID=A0A167WBL1_9EURO|nr:hypothetical protein AAP_04736 [Ascosphaera apis ARSEF 7405]